MRLFVAIFPPEELRRKIWEVGEEIRGIWRREPPEKLHITLKFIGEVSEERAREIGEALRALRFPAFDVEVVGGGAFPSLKRPRVLWVGVRSEPLQRLQELVEEALAVLGIPREWRDFVPHITLGRARGPVEAEHLTTLGHIGSFRVTSFFLVRSYLRPEGSVYEVVEEYGLED